MMMIDIHHTIDVTDNQQRRIADRPRTTSVFESDPLKRVFLWLTFDAEAKKKLIERLSKRTSAWMGADAVDTSDE